MRTWQDSDYFDLDLIFLLFLFSLLILFFLHFALILKRLFSEIISFWMIEVHKLLDEIYKWPHFQVSKLQSIKFPSLLGPGPHLPPLSLQPPHSLLSPLCSHCFSSKSTSEMLKRWLEEQIDKNRCRSNHMRDDMAMFNFNLFSRHNDLLGPWPHLPPLPLEPPHSLLSPLCSHFKTTFFCNDLRFKMIWGFT